RFHDVLREYFLREVSSHGHGHFQFDAVAHRRYLTVETDKLLSRVSMLAALAIEETCPGATVARFDEWLLCRGKPKSLTTERIADKLNTAFAGANFQVTTQEER